MNVRGCRKIASATWGRPNDPQIYGDLGVDATRLLAFIAEARRVTGVHVTVTHIVGKALAQGLTAPELIATRRRTGAQPSADIFFVVAIGDGKELSGVKVEGADRKSVVEIADELMWRGPDFARATARWECPSGCSPRPRSGCSAPCRGSPPCSRATGRSISSGSACRGAHSAARWSARSGCSASRRRTGRSLALPNPDPRAGLRGRGEAGRRRGPDRGAPILTVTATMDHRYLDGAHAAGLARTVRAYLEDPAAFETLPAPDQAAEASSAGPGSPRAGPGRGSTAPFRRRSNTRRSRFTKRSCAQPSGGPTRPPSTSSTSRSSTAGSSRRSTGAPTRWPRSDSVPATGSRSRRLPARRGVIAFTPRPSSARSPR
jgi:hypothetical protein